MPKDRLRIFFDGGCRPNPGMMEVAAVARGVTYLRTDLGQGSSEESEWRALLNAVEVALTLGEEDVELVGDSRSVIGQANGITKCRSAEMRPHLEAYRAAISAIPHVRLRHVVRTKNLAGIALARRHPR